MNLIKKIALAAALSSFAISASAMSPIQDPDLSQVSGQDGVSIAANLNVNIGSFTYTNTAAGTGGSVSFNNIAITGLVAATLDVMSGLVANWIFSSANGVTTNTFFDGKSDVVLIAIPAATTIAGGQAEKGVSVKIGGITMGNSTASFGAIALNNIDMRGTYAMIWAH